MKVFGIGIDVVEVGRIERLIKEGGGRFVERVFTAAEREYCNGQARPAVHYAARFAAKEAVAKAFGTGIGEHLGWCDMEVARDANGAPRLVLGGAGKAFAQEAGIAEVMISLTHAREYAAANAVALCVR